jgi:hypothetical protein
MPVIERALPLPVLKLKEYIEFFFISFWQVGYGHRVKTQLQMMMI